MRNKIITFRSNKKGEKLTAEGQREKREKGESVSRAGDIPVSTYIKDNNLFPDSMQAMHMRNFIDCVRSRERTRYNEDDGLEEAAVCIMSVIAYKEKRQVTFDSARQEVV